eukprot:scaffold31765_cov67-Phaeocystis_antarctica.AAC.3
MCVRQAYCSAYLPPTSYRLLPTYPTDPPAYRRRPTARPSRWAIQRAARRRGHPSHGSCSRRAARPMLPSYHPSHGSCSRRAKHPCYLVITPRTARARGEPRPHVT